MHHSGLWAPRANYNRKVTLKAVGASKHLATFYAKQFKLHEDIVELLDTFREERRAMLAIRTPRPAVIFALAQDKDVTLPGRLADRYKDIVAQGFSWVDYVMDPCVSKDDIKQATFEISALAVAGLVAVSSSKYALLSFAEDDTTLVQRMAILQLMDPSADLSELAELVPKSSAPGGRSFNAGKSEELALLLSRYGGSEVDVQEACADPFDGASFASQHDVHAAQRQIEEPAGDGDENPAKKRKLNKGDFDMTNERVKKYIDQIIHVFKAVLIAQREECGAYEFGRRFAPSIEDEAERKASIATSFKLLGLMHLGKMSLRGGSVFLARPAEDAEVSRMALKLSDLFGLEKDKVEQRLKVGRSTSLTTLVKLMSGSRSWTHWSEQALKVQRILHAPHARRFLSHRWQQVLLLRWLEELLVKTVQVKALQYLPRFRHASHAL